MSLNHSFAGKNVLVTGGASGIGRQVVQRFYDGGATVFTVDKNPDAIQKLKQELPNIRAEVLDIANWDETRKMVESFGTIDHLVNNAAISPWQHFMDITKEASQLTYAINFEAIINVSQVVAKGMIKAGNGGTIVNMSSTIAEKYLAGLSVYGALKAGLIQLTKFMAVELGTHGIRVNCIQPGAVDTPMARDDDGVLNPDVQSLVDNGTVMKRLIETNELADLILFLLSPLSSAITGQAVKIDAGWHF